ncbi:MAG: biopolymer transporter ExbD [Deltaproteobacteria bacterium]|nr:biopolymer transporter ExbD [Deltaproteobacteria bacterium]
MEFERRKRVLLHTNIAPLVDVVFLLLLFFMVTSRIMVSSSIEVALPTSATSDAASSEEIILLVTEKGELYLGNRNVSMQEIGRELRREIRRFPARPVTIKADKTIPLSLLVKVIDEVRLAGASTFTIATERT